MTDDAEKEASEVLHSLLWVERIANTTDNLLQAPPAYSISSESNEQPSITTAPKRKAKRDTKTQAKSAKKTAPKPPPKPIPEDKEHALTQLESSPKEVLERLQFGCECNQNCYKSLNAESVYKHRLNIAELTKTEHDMYLMGVTMACLGKRTETSRHKERKRQRANYVYQGKKVCVEAFLYLENLTHYHLKRIRSHVMAHGVTPRVHGNMGRKPHNTFSLGLYKSVEIFLKDYLKQNSHDFTRPLVITNDTRTNIYSAYKSHCSADEKIMGYSTFRHFMKKQFPNVRFPQRFENPKASVSNSSGISAGKDGIAVRKKILGEPKAPQRSKTVTSNIVEVVPSNIVIQESIEEPIEDNNVYEEEDYAFDYVDVEFIQDDAK